MAGTQRWDAFLSHIQLSGGLQVMVVQEALHLVAAEQGRELRLWWDQDETATSEGMLQGVQGSSLFVLFVTPGLLQRPAVQHEVKTALTAGKPMLAVVDQTAWQALDPAVEDLRACIRMAVAEGCAFSAAESAPRGQRRAKLDEEELAQLQAQLQQAG